MSSIYQSVLAQTVAVTPQTVTSLTKVPQSSPLPDKIDLMKKNYAGGYTFIVTDEERLRRILILGTHTNTYYATAKQLTTESIEFINDMIKKGKGMVVLNELMSVFKDSRAPKLDPLFMVWGILCRASDVELRRKACSFVSSEIKALTHLYMWKGYHKKAGITKGWGQLVKKAINDWIIKLTPQQFAYQAYKYQQRTTGNENWSLRDFLRCAHIDGKSLPVDKQIIIRSIVKQDITCGIELAKELKCENTVLIDYLQSISIMKSLTESSDNINTIVQFINKHNFTREFLPTWALNHLAVWKALMFNGDTSLDTTRVTMPFTALIRNINKMTICGLFDNTIYRNKVVQHITNQDVIKKSHIHPLTILLAQLTYSKGCGDKGKLTWVPNSDIVNALSDAFYSAFNGSKATGKRILHAIDCSPSMTSPIPTLPNLTSSQAVAIMSMVFARTESLYCVENNLPLTQEFVGFSSGSSLVRIPLKHTDTFDYVTKALSIHNWASTDCSLPILNAIEEYKKTAGKAGLYDVFMIYTDNETFTGSIHPSKALQDYRELTGIPAKLIVVATLASGTSIADPTDTGMMDIIGFDSNAPQMIHSFLVDSQVARCAEDDEYEIL